MWDLYILGGYEVVFNIGLALLKMHEDQLLKMKFEQILTFFAETLPKEPMEPEDLIGIYKRIRMKTKNHIHIS